METQDLKLARKYINKASNARTNALDFTLSFSRYKRLQHTKKCYYCGTKMSVSDTAEQLPHNLTIDRLDPSVGYTDENSVAACNGCNQLKSKMEYNIPQVGKILKRIAQRKPELLDKRLVRGLRRAGVPVGTLSIHGKIVV